MTYPELLNELYTVLPKTNMDRFPAEFGIARVKLLLKQLGNPQEKVQVVHIAGTSGKGSTAVMIAKLLQVHGKKTGLHVTPHMYDVRERFQINSELVSETVCVDTYSRLKSHFNAVNAAEMGNLTYFEVLIALAYLIFAEAKVDVAIIETGVGGLLDGTNVVDNPEKICVLNSIGLDHMAILGSTLPEIAAQKAGIIHTGNTVVALEQSSEVNDVFASMVKKADAMVYWVQPAIMGPILSSTKEGSQFDCDLGSSFPTHLALKALHVALPGKYQVENALLALATLSVLASKLNFPLDESQIRTTLTTISYPGRFDVCTIAGKTVVLDGAHNPQKMKAFLDSLKNAFPNTSFSFIIAFKEGKDVAAMISQLVPLAASFVISNFFNSTIDFMLKAVTPQAVASLISSETAAQSLPVVPVEMIPDSAPTIIDIIKKQPAEVVVITGSLYFLSEILPSLRQHGIEV